MLKPKELVKEVFISSGSDCKQSPNRSNKGASSCSKREPKTPHPPIETYWQLPPIHQQRSRGLMKILSQPFKYMWRSQSQKLLLEGTHNPKDEMIVDAFRELLFLDGHLAERHLDYHTLLRLFHFTLMPIFPELLFRRGCTYWSRVWFIVLFYRCFLIVISIFLDVRSLSY